MRIFILEDDPARIAAFEIAIGEGHDVTVCQFIRGKDGAAEEWKPPYDLILLDHDLGGLAYVDSDEDETGYTFAVLMGKAPKELQHAIVMIHSWNTVAAKRMQDLLQEHGWLAECKTFDLKLLRALQTYCQVVVDETPTEVSEAVGYGHGV